MGPVEIYMNHFVKGPEAEVAWRELGRCIGDYIREKIVRRSPAEITLDILGPFLREDFKERLMNNKSVSEEELHLMNQQLMGVNAADTHRLIADLRQVREERLNELCHRAAHNLLARIHRDGGHHTHNVGFVQACEDAEQEWLQFRARIAKLEGLLIRAKDAVGVAHLAVKDNHPLHKATRKLWDDIEAALGHSPCKETDHE